jgi:hypothetical protein
LFDFGYITIDPDELRAVVSRGIREEFENGWAYYAFHGTRIRVPNDPGAVPAREFLTFHSEQVFRP